MVRIPAGTFQMGSNDGGTETTPVHTVKVDTFEMDVTEVTVAQYRACVRAGACQAQSTTSRDWFDRGSLNETCNYDKPGHGKHPMNCVDWHQAGAFCSWAGKRLPTDEEWEYAARGTDGRKYPWGNDAPSALRLNACGPECVAWAGATMGVDWRPPLYPKSDHWELTAPVGSFPNGDSPFGVHDMAGNVLEWTSTADEMPEPFRSPLGTDARILRGTCFFDVLLENTAAAARHREIPSVRLGILGFRCAR
jgi:formylglycine-generating enzyme required for sulfatase activity